MLRAVPHSLFSWDFTVYDGEEPVADLHLAWFREKGEVTIGGVPCTLYREKLFSGAFVLEAGGQRMVEAVKPSAFRRSFEITYEGKQLVLEAQSVLGRTFELSDRGGTLGTISPDHVFTRKLTADLSERLPLAVRVFVIWLVILLWKRSADAASSSG